MSLLAKLSTSIRRAARNQRQGSQLGHQLCQGPYLMPAPTGTLWNPGHHLCRVGGTWLFRGPRCPHLEDWNDHTVPHWLSRERPRSEIGDLKEREVWGPV